MDGTPAERILVTGALGCIGAWTVESLVDEGDVEGTSREEAAAGTVARFRARPQDDSLRPEEHGLTA